MLSSPGSIAFTILSIDIRWYGIIMAIAILSGILAILTIRKKFYKEITEDSILDISFLLIFFGILSARLYYVILDWNYFSCHPEQILCIWNGGISIHGAIIGGIISAYIYTKIKKIDFLKYADLFSFGIITGQIIGRWGNFFNSEAFGLPCDLPWKLYIPYDSRPIGYQNYQYFHPTFLYESIANFILLILLIYILKKDTKRKTGTIFFLYIGFYSIIRQFIETIRIDSILNITDTIHIAHIASFSFLVFSIIGLYYIHSKKV